jgi:alkylation response protein AidB-like acyl-CoA dehydrogenase
VGSFRNGRRLAQKVTWRVNPFPSPLHAREGADGQAVVCPLLRGSSPTRGVAPKQHRAKAGLLSTAVGGRDGSLHGPLDARSLCICREVLARHAGLADFSFAMQGLGTGPISLFGTDEQKERWLPSVARGTTISAFALSEREAGSDVSALAMRAQPDGNQWCLDGAKTWISNAGIAGSHGGR